MTRSVPQPGPDDYDDDQDPAFLGVAYRDDGDVPKLVVVGMVWVAGGVVALIAAVLAKNLALAVFGVLGLVAGGLLWIALRARDQIVETERYPYVDPSAGHVEDDEGYDEGYDDAPDDDHPTRVMSTGGGEHGDDVVDAEYAEYTDYLERTPSEQDDGTGYDDDRVAQDRWERAERDREAATAADERQDGRPDEQDAGHDEADGPVDGSGRDTGDDTGSDTGNRGRPDGDGGRG